MWLEEWRRPQAIVWDELAMARQVALYVRAYRIAEGAKATAADRAVVLRMQDELGLSVGGLKKNLWLIVDDSPAARATGTDGAPSPARSRWKELDLEVVDGGGD